jgi:hypothetical protein
MSNKINLSNKKTTNLDLAKYAKLLNVPVTIMMNDQFKIPRLGYYILNLENHGEDGSHWITIICGKKECFYFDSFGAPPTKNVHIRLRERYGKIYMNNKIIQDLNSDMCGLYCLGLIVYVHRHQHISLLTACDQYLNMFDDDTEKNNSILKEYFNSLF